MNHSPHFQRNDGFESTDSQMLKYRYRASVRRSSSTSSNSTSANSPLTTNSVSISSRCEAFVDHRLARTFRETTGPRKKLRTDIFGTEFWNELHFISPPFRRNDRFERGHLILRQYVC